MPLGLEWKMRSWGTFLDFTKFSIPQSDEIPLRVEVNLKYYIMNYTIIAIVIILWGL